MSRKPPAPQHLRPETKAWWRSVVRDYFLEPHHLLLLQAACEALDRAAEARAILDKEGLTVPTANGGQKQHPAAQIEFNSRLSFARLLRELDLDAEEPPEGGRPPALRSNRRL